MTIFLGNGDGSFQPRIPFLHAENRMNIQNEVQLIDFNRDGQLDVVSLCWTRAEANNEALMIALGRGPKLDPTRGALIRVQRPSLAEGPTVLEASTDFLTWRPATTNTARFHEWLFNDVGTSQKQQFYRTRRP